MGKEKYKVTSKTTRDIEGWGDFCWMEIRAKKLNNAVKDQDVYHFLCCIGGEIFAYSYPAAELRRAFEDKHVRLRGEKSQRYSFFLEYPTGKIFRKLSVYEGEENHVCTLTPEKTDENEVQEQAGDKPIIPAECKADEKLRDALKASQCDHLPKLVARTALWATKEEYDECIKNGSTAKYPKICRKPNGEKRGKKGDMYYDDNSYPNAQMKASLKKQGIIPRGYETCHIWEKTCYKPEYHTCFANLVLLPRAIASLSDHDDTVKAILKWHAYERFNGFVPEGYIMPEKPAVYNRIKDLFND